MTIRTLKTSLLVFAACAMIGCGDDDKGTQPKSGFPDQLVGLWTFQSASVNGIPCGIGNVVPMGPDAVAARIAVSADGSFVFDNIKADSTVFYDSPGTFTVNGASFAITGNPDLPYSGTWAVDGNQLTLSADVGGYAVEIIATK